MKNYRVWEKPTTILPSKELVDIRKKQCEDKGVEMSEYEMRLPSVAYLKLFYSKSRQTKELIGEDFRTKK